MNNIIVYIETQEGNCRCNLAPYKEISSKDLMSPGSTHYREFCELFKDELLPLGRKAPLQRIPDLNYHSLYSAITVSLFKEKLRCFFATPLGRDLAPRVSSALSSGLTADCTSLEIGTYEPRTSTRICSTRSDLHSAAI